MLHRSNIRCLKRAESRRTERDQLLVGRERQRQGLVACDAAAGDEQRGQSSLARLGSLLPARSPGEQIELGRPFVERVEIREPAKTKFGANVNDSEARRVLSFRLKLHLPKLVEGLEQAAGSGKASRTHQRPLSTAIWGVSFETNVDFMHAIRGEVTILAPFRYAVRISNRTRLVPPSLIESADQPQHLIVRAQAWRRMLETGHVRNRFALAKRHGLTPGAITRIMKPIQRVPEIQNFLAALNSKEAIRHFGMKKVGALSDLSPDAPRVAFERIRKAFAKPTPALVCGDLQKATLSHHNAPENLTDTELIIALLRKRGPTAPREIATDMNLNRVTAYRRLSLLAASGQIAVTGKTKRTKYSVVAG